MRSVYPHTFRPTELGGWFVLAAREPYAEGAIALLEERIGLHRHQFIFDENEWIRANLHQRLELLREWVAIEFVRALVLADTLVECMPVSTVGD